MNSFDQAAHVFAVPVDVFDIVHDRFYQTNTQAALALFVDQIAYVRSMKFIDIEDRTIINNFENDLTVSGMNMQFYGMVRVTMMRMYHEIGAHFIHCQYDSTDLHIGQTLPLQRLPDEVADALKVT